MEKETVLIASRDLTSLVILPENTSDIHIYFVLFLFTFFMAMFQDFMTSTIVYRPLKIFITTKLGKETHIWVASIEWSTLSVLCLFGSWVCENLFILIKK